MTRFPTWLKPELRGEWERTTRQFHRREELIMAVMVLRQRLRNAEARGERERGVTGIEGVVE